MTAKLVKDCGHVVDMLSLPNVFFFFFYLLFVT